MMRLVQTLAEFSTLAVSLGRMLPPDARSLSSGRAGPLRSRLRREAGFWGILASSTPTKIAQAAFFAMLNWRSLRVLYEAPSGGALARCVAARPEIWSMVLAPFVAAHWPPRERFERIVDHCESVERLGPLLDLPADSYVDLLTLEEIGPEFRLVLDQPRWLLRDGLSALSLWEGRDRLFSISFCLSSRNGCLTAYVGGLQGRREDGVVDRYRDFTKRAHGMRPADMITELFRMFCQSLGVRRILAVSEAIRHQQSAYCRRTIGESAASTLSYDDHWRGRGATLASDGFFDLPVTPVRRSEQSILPKKRSMYRRRYACLDLIATRLDASIAGGLKPGMLARHSC